MRAHISELALHIYKDSNTVSDGHIDKKLIVSKHRVSTILTFTYIYIYIYIYDVVVALPNTVWTPPSIYWMFLYGNFLSDHAE